MELLQAAILGLVQGASEFLPISSSGHLILVPYLFNWHGVVDSLSFDVALHVGTTIAVVAFFWKDWVSLLSAFLKKLPEGVRGIWSDEKARFFSLLVVGSVPAGVVGVVFDKYAEKYLRNSALVASLLIGFAAVLYLADQRGRRDRTSKSISLLDSVVIGCAQTLALLPGVSRSGITITAGLFRDLDRQSATRFSFLLSTPVILGAGLIKLKDILHGSVGGSMGVFVVGTIFAAISGWITIKLLLQFVQKNNFTAFIVYRVLVGLLIFLVIFTRK